MERLLHYVWQHRLYPFGSLFTHDRQPIEVLDPGLHNEDAGPDFLDAKLKVGNETWVGNIEIHSVSTDWYAHGHDKDEAYNNVILHVVEKDAGKVMTANNRLLEQVVVKVPEDLEEHYDELLREDRFPPCYRNVENLPQPLVREWLDRLASERLESKTARINKTAALLGGDWEKVFFITLARSFGFGINGDAFEEWAKNIPLMAAGKHRNDIFQIEAMFLGQAGLLEDDMVPEAYREEALREGYFQKLQHEYRFLAHKFTLHAMDGSHWRFLRLRPQNFPHIRLVELANLYVSNHVSLSSVMEAKTPEEARAMFHTEVTPYWQTHYVFGAPSRKSMKQLRESSIDSILINMSVPMLYAYGRHRFHPEYCERALKFLSQISLEENHITKVWKDMGLQVSNAADSQALIELRNCYCDRKDCLRCSFGWEYLKQTKTYHVLREE
jgi:hypothetical protein